MEGSTKEKKEGWMRNGEMNGQMEGRKDGSTDRKLYLSKATLIKNYNTLHFCSSQKPGGTTEIKRLKSI